MIEVIENEELLFIKYFSGNIKEYNALDTKILQIYGKYLIFKNLFYDVKYNKIVFSEPNCKKYELIFNSLNNFVTKCKSIITDSVELTKLFNAACNEAVDYIYSSDKET